MYRLLDPAVECDLLLALVRVEDVLVEFQITFGQLSRSWFLLQSHLDGIPVAPPVGGAAGYVEVLLHPKAESAVLVLYVVAGTLSAEPVTEPVEQRRQGLLGKLLMLLPCGYDRRLEFLFAELGYVDLVVIDWPKLCPFC
jgi:hypothetical protein